MKMACYLKRARTTHWTRVPTGRDVSHQTWCGEGCVNFALPALTQTLDRLWGIPRMKTPNLFFCAIILILVPSVSAQTSNNVRRTLGKPVTKVYRVDPNISVTINYDTEGQVCDIQLAGSYSSAQKFADKLIPIKSRGRQLGPAVGLIAMDCCQSFA